MRHLSLLAFVVAAFAASDAGAFAFLCNGIDADGNVESDGCGACNANSAARWDELQVDFAFDDNVRPPEVSLAEWQANQAATIANWNNVEGQSLTIRDGGAASFREFGDINGENSIFWVTSRNEFNQKVGGGINSILGVTLAPYNCGNPRRGGIEDADMIMNGTGSFDWDQTSVVSTMTHEMGHAIGFGHPCVDCVATSIMSATGGGPDDSEVPLFDDQEAIRALYPGTPGGIGTACDVDSDCNDNTCVTAQIGGVDRSFCSQTCGSCPSGMVCTAVAGEGNVCVFSNAGIADVGDACGPPGCINECEGFNVDAGCNVCLDTCFAGCRVAGNVGCPAGEQCFPFGCNADNQCLSGSCGANGVCNDTVGICGTPGGTAGRGQACSENVGCADGLACLGDATGGVCFGLCDAGGSGCLQSENCLFLLGDAIQGVCIDAGAGEEGDACTELVDCGRGLLCVGGACEQRCDRGFECVAATQNCVGVSGGGDMSVCDGPAEGEGEPNEGEGEPAGDCDVSRGNFDCPAGSSCDGGACVSGEGPVGTFALCDVDTDCSGGICQNGVCTRPCDVADGCPAAYSCDENAGVTGGLCVADSCANNAAICGEGFTCTFSSAQRNVCAKGVAAGGICNCSSTGGDAGGPVFGLSALAAVSGLLLRRRRR